jgi:hypothetical protein
LKNEDPHTLEKECKSLSEELATFNNDICEHHTHDDLIVFEQIATTPTTIGLGQEL